MGSGKTSYVINKINEDHTRHTLLSLTNDDHGMPCYLYVTPFLTECQRIVDSCPELRFKQPKNVDGRKLDHLYDLVQRGENIACTHSLFKKLSPELCASLKENGYELILDEVLDTIAEYDGIKASDRAILVREKMVSTDPSGKWVWNHELHAEYDGRFRDEMKLCDNGSLVVSKRGPILNVVPVEFFQCFTNVTVLTYLFEASVMAAQLRANDVPYEKVCIDNGKLVAYGTSEAERQLKARAKELITIYEGEANRHGDKPTSFSSGWSGKLTDELAGAIRRSTEYVFRHVFKTSAKYNAYTAVKKAKGKLKGEGYTRGMIPCNARATNEFSHKASLAYLFNVYPSPIVRGYLSDIGSELDQDVYALAQLVQWIWRSAIRNGEPINIYIPSSRMRLIFKDWLNDKLG